MGRMLRAAGGIVCGFPSALIAGPRMEDDVTFYVVADSQVHLDKWGTAGTEATIRTMNSLPVRELPGGGKVGMPRAVLVLGDMVDTVEDPRHWQAYKRMFDPTGDAMLRFPVLEGIGNHDLSAESAGGWNSVQRDHINRNKVRAERFDLHFCENQYHYSWDWGPLHLVNLNLFPGNAPRPVYDRDAPWNDPKQSLEFLRRDLREKVGTTGRPVVLMWHYGLRGWGLEKWWRSDDLAALKEVIAPYRVVLILHGHEHSFARYTWEGYPVFMCPSPQRDRNPDQPGIDSTAKGFLVVKLTAGELMVFHHNESGWADVWRRTISGGTGKP